MKCCNNHENENCTVCAVGLQGNTGPALCPEENPAIAISHTETINMDEESFLSHLDKLGYPNPEQIESEDHNPVDAEYMPYSQIDCECAGDSPNIYNGSRILVVGNVLIPL